MESSAYSCAELGNEHILKNIRKAIRNYHMTYMMYTFVLPSSSSLLERVVLNASVCCGAGSFGLLRIFLASAHPRRMHWLQSTAVTTASSQKRIFSPPARRSKSVQKAEDGLDLEKYKRTARRPTRLTSLEEK